MDQVPAPVKDILVKEAGNYEIEEIEVTCHGHYQVYEAEWIMGDKEVEIQVVYMCKLFKKEIEPVDDDEDEGDDDDDDNEGDDDDDEDELHEKAVSFNQLPASVKEALAKAAGKNTIREIEEIVTKESKFYEAEWIVDGWEHEIILTEQGKLYRQVMELVQDDDDEDEEGDDDDDDEDDDDDDDDDD